MSPEKKDHPEFADDQYLGLTELNFYRQRYIESTMQEELGALTSLEQDVLESMQQKLMEVQEIQIEMMKDIMKFLSQG